MKNFMLADYLNRNGMVAERARRAGRSLDRTEQNIILAGRRMAQEKGLSRERINELEMDGERDWDRVLAPIKVIAVFAYYDDPYEDIPANPSFLVRHSNHPGLPEGGHVCPEQLLEAGQKIPHAPTYENWVRDGRKAVRS